MSYKITFIPKFFILLYGYDLLIFFFTFFFVWQHAFVLSYFNITYLFKYLDKKKSNFRQAVYELQIFKVKMS